MRLLNVDTLCMKKYPRLSEYLSSWVGSTLYAAVDEDYICSIIVMTADRILNVYTLPDCRRGGYATSLINLAVAKGAVIVAVPPQEKAATMLFTSCGFSMTGSQEGMIVMEYKDDVDILYVDHFDVARDELEELLESIQILQVPITSYR